MIIQTGTADNGCDAGYVQFHGTESESIDRWCGEAFNSQESATTGGTMRGNQNKLIINYFCNINNSNMDKLTDHFYSDISFYLCFKP